MSEFGEKLRQERESRGITLGSITEATKISNRYLVALETGKFDYLPGGIFNKGIMRSYARVVGLNEETWVNRFMSAYRESGQVKDDDVYWIAFAENVGKSRNREQAARPRLHLNWAGITVLLVVLVALGWAFWHYVDDKTAASTASQAAATKAMSQFDCLALPSVAQHKLV
jgi:cytoskeleton protein RodZ